MEEKEEKKSNYIKIAAIVLLVIALLIGGFSLYKSLNKDTNTNGEKDNNQQEQKEKLTPVLYEVTKEGSTNKMYLFGSIHLTPIGDLDLLPDYVLNAYDNSHYLACEVDVDKAQTNPETVSNVAAKTMYTDGTTLQDHMSEELYSKLVDFFTKKGVSKSKYNKFKMGQSNQIITLLTAKDAKLNGTGIDAYFLSKAKKDKKTILELETYEFQVDILYGLSDELYEYMINSYIDNYDEDVQNLVYLYDSWKTGNIEGIVKATLADIEVEDDVSETIKKEMNDYIANMITNRNITMADKAIEYFDNNQDVFFMVGASHIVGDGGVAQILEGKGYTVTQVK